MPTILEIFKTASSINQSVKTTLLKACSDLKLPFQPTMRKTELVELLRSEFQKAKDLSILSVPSIEPSTPVSSNKSSPDCDNNNPCLPSDSLDEMPPSISLLHRLENLLDYMEIAVQRLEMCPVPSVTPPVGH